MAKAQNKTIANDASVEVFLAAVPDPQRRADALAVDAMMRKATGCEPKMWGGAIVGYGECHYVYDSGREGDMPIVGFSPRKQNLVLYVVLPGSKRQAPLLQRLGKHKTGKSCLYLNKLADVDVAVLEKLIVTTVAVMRKTHRP